MNINQGQPSYQRSKQRPGPSAGTEPPAHAAGMCSARTAWPSAPETKGSHCTQLVNHSIQGGGGVTQALRDDVAGRPYTPSGELSVAALLVVRALFTEPPRSACRGPGGSVGGAQWVTCPLGRQGNRPLAERLLIQSHPASLIKKLSQLP